MQRIAAQVPAILATEPAHVAVGQFERGQLRVIGVEHRDPRSEHGQVEDFDTLLLAARQKSMTIVPIRLLTAGRFIKVVIALGKGKKLYDKRETIKRRDQSREAAKAIKRA